MFVGLAQLAQPNQMLPYGVNFIFVPSNYLGFMLDFDQTTIEQPQKAS
jgi:hypothetical protein